MSDSGLERFILDKLEKLDDKLDQVREEYTKLTLSQKNHEAKDDEIHKDVRDMAEKFTQQLDEQCRALHEYNRQLEIHIQGVEMNKDSLVKMWERVAPVVEAHEQETVAKRWLSERAKTRIKWITMASGAVGAITAIMKFLEMF